MLSRTKEARQGCLMFANFSPYLWPVVLYVLLFWEKPCPVTSECVVVYCDNPAPPVQDRNQKWSWQTAGTLAPVVRGSITWMAPLTLPPPQQLSWTMSILASKLVCPPLVSQSKSKLWVKVHSQSLKVKFKILKLKDLGLDLLVLPFKLVDSN